MSHPLCIHDKRGSRSLLLRKIHFAFNVWNYESACAVIDASAFLHRDVIIQTSSSVFSELDAPLFSSFVKAYASSLGVNAYLNLDHCRDEGLLKMAVDSGWDMVMADGSSMPLDENIAFVNCIAVYAHEKDVLVEGEVGQIRGVEDELCVRNAVVASKKDIALFLDKACIDMVAVAFGNAHGAYKAPPALDFDLVEYTIGQTSIPFVVHGASGMPVEDIVKLIKMPGVVKVNVSTDLKNAYLNCLEFARDAELLQRDGFQPLSIDKLIKASINEAVVEKLKILDM